MPDVQRGPSGDTEVDKSEKLFWRWRGVQSVWAQGAANNEQLAENIPFTPDEQAAIEGRGLAPIGVNFRGCSGEPNLSRKVFQQPIPLRLNSTGQ